ncbi:MAG: RNA pseudouridine synthase [Muribaculaceae bacterium]|nr:RNA pseudouridine synthase [Muribaculaceae bacterium]
MNNPFDYLPDKPCREAFLKLLSRIEGMKKSECPEERAFCRELESGKMLGVMIASGEDGERHILYAFSGQLGAGGFHYPGFVGPVFDYLDPAGYFKTREREISLCNREIAEYEAGEFFGLRSRYEAEKERVDREVEAVRKRYRLSKKERDIRREEGVNKDELNEMVRQSQFEKAEFRRLKRRLMEELSHIEEEYREACLRLESMKRKRRADSEALQGWLFDNFRLPNARGESRSLAEIFAETPFRIPPSGAGECCGPKLLQEAYRKRLLPLAMAEYWYGRPKEGEIRMHGRYYPACRGKCVPVLQWMLQGLEVEPPLGAATFSRTLPEPEIVFENEWFCVVEKPSGMLSVPGKGSALSLQQWLINKYGTARGIKLAHRLDRDTSGLVMAAFGDRAYKELQALFAKRLIHKTYVADLEGDWRINGLPQSGSIELPLSPDWLDRPRQLVDHSGGKEALTLYEFGEVSQGRSRVLFHPLTGRTHQLRVHAAAVEGLGMPIVGDPLYGITGDSTCGNIETKLSGDSGSGRLHLHASRIEFDFPPDGCHYEFESPLPFV